MWSSHAPKPLTAYAIIDEESTNTFAASPLIDKLNPKNRQQHHYTVTTASTSSSTPHDGRIARNLRVRGHGMDTWHRLPEAYELPTIPDSRDEVCTPEDARAIPSLAPYADEFLPRHESAEVMLLIGRDSGDLMVTKTIGDHVPLLHRTPLGTAAVGCPSTGGAKGVPRTLTTLKGLRVDRTFRDNNGTLGTLPEVDPLFQTRPDDETEDLSVEDRDFLDHINEEIKIVQDHGQQRIQCPLPWRGRTEPRMPDNSRGAYACQRSMLKDLERHPDRKAFYYEAMGKNIANRHVERVPDSEVHTETGKCWYLPTFVARNKKNKLRAVFDSARRFGDPSTPKGAEVCLNDKMLQGPDRTSSLSSVLLRFRENQVGFIADVESMFHCFLVDPVHRDYLRFYHNEDNDPDKPLVPYRARVHIFGNCGSPSVSNISFRTTTEWADPPPSADVTKYITTHFYVDDGLGSAPDAATAIATLHGSRDTLKQFGVRLHKITSHNQEVVRAFPESEVAKDVLEVLLSEDDCPEQKALGVVWDLRTDALKVKVNIPDKPFTKRGVLATISSTYDPLSLAGPVTLAGRLFQRRILPKKGEDPEMFSRGWDDPLPAEHQSWWEGYKARLVQLEKLSTPRCLIPPGFGKVVRQELVGFSDAATESIGFVIYARSQNAEGRIHCAFLKAGSKVAPSGATSIPRLELCGALALALAVQDVKGALHRKPDHTTCYTDSKVVLGYLQNRERRFSKYVTRRVAAIANLETDWRFVGTADNVADLASRPTTPRKLLRSPWLRGPDFIWSNQDHPTTYQELSPGELPELETEARIMATRLDPVWGPLSDVFRTLAVKKSPDGLFSTVFEKQSNWQKAVGIATKMMDFIRKTRGSKDNPGQLTPEEWLVREAQRTAYPDVISLLSKGKPLPMDHPLESLAPVLTTSGVLRVGGRLDRAKLPFDRRHPLLVPRAHPAATMIISHYHRKTGHQGRVITHGAVREGGFHLEAGPMAIKAFLRDCVLCRRLRAKLAEQRMADLPLDRLSSAVPFSTAALDVLGPWKVVRGKTTRRTQGEVKIWLLCASCQASRAIHIELLEGLDTSTLKNALSRFVDRRGTVQCLRSDQGTNFVGAQSEDQSDVDVDELKESMKAKNVEWLMNVPHASHMGGSWERKNRDIRKVLEGTMSLLGPRKLSYDELHTFVVEAESIINATPLWDISSDPNDPAPLSPQMILTLREVPPPPPAETFSEEDLLSYGRRRWRRVQYLSTQFWKRWQDMYISNLTERNKWNRVKPNLAVGDIVMMRDKAGPRNQWPIGRITSVKYSADNLVRSVEVAVKRTNPKGVPLTSIYSRPISEIVFLMKG